VWSVDVNKTATRMVTGAADRQLRVWSLERGEKEKEKEEEEEHQVVYMGSVVRESNDRCVNVKYVCEKECHCYYDYYHYCFPSVLYHNTARFVTSHHHFSSESFVSFFG